MTQDPQQLRDTVQHLHRVLSDIAGRARNARGEDADEMRTALDQIALEAQQAMAVPTTPLPDPE